MNDIEPDTALASEVMDVIVAHRKLGKNSYRSGLDPVPSNAELLARDLDELNGDGFLIHNRHKDRIANLLIERGWVKQSVGEAR